MPRALVLATLMCACALVPVPASPQVRRCTAADGSLVFTDRKCEDLGAQERLPPPAEGGSILDGLRPTARFSCQRNVQDLSYALGSALQSGDANQVAGLYDWAGMSSSTAYRVMDRLDLIARRQVVDVQPVYAGGTNEYGDAIVQFDADGRVVPVAPQRPRLMGLRVEQTLANGSTPSRTTFGLRQRMGCWWITL